MTVRASRISASIARAVSQESDTKISRSAKLVRSVVAFFSLFSLTLTCYCPDEFLTLRHDVWQMDEDEYLRAFRASAASAEAAGPRRDKGKARETELHPVGDLGYSGSAFFTTLDAKYLIKSLPRRSEYDFFKSELYAGYVRHMKLHPNSMLVRITDMVFAPSVSLGGILGTAPTHHIIMENLLFGRDAEDDADMSKDWETYDLKPSSYFFPERDIADGNLVSDSVKDKLVDEFPGHIRVSAAMKRDLVKFLEQDTSLLAQHQVVDYSLFVVRFPGPRTSERRQTPPRTKAQTHPWRRGVDDVDGKWTYRAVVLDFFWAKNTARAMAMTGLVGALNLFARKGPMSITAEPGEYRERFLRMVDDIVVASG